MGSRLTGRVINTACLFFLTLGATSLVNAQDVALALRTAPFPECPNSSGRCEIETDIPSFLADVLMFSQVPGGFSELSSDLRPYTAAYQIEFRPRGSTLKDLLDAITLAESSYKWGTVNGVINVAPVSDYPLLDRRIVHFAGSGTATQLIAQLESTPDFKASLEHLGLHSIKPVASDQASELVQSYAWRCAPRDTYRLSVEFKNATVREILNGIVLKSQSAVWHYRQTGDRYELSTMVY